MQNLKLTTLASLSMASLAILASCQDEDFGYTTQDVRNSVYARNFEKHYGKIAADQTWDFSRDNLDRLGLVGGPTAQTRALTRAGGSHPVLDGYAMGGQPSGLFSGKGSESATYELQSDKTNGQSGAKNISNIPVSTTPDGWYPVDNSTLTWLNTKLSEKNNHRSLGDAFSFSKSDREFMIIPIYEGQAGMRWSLHIADQGSDSSTPTDYMIWSRSEGLLYKANESNTAGNTESSEYWVKPMAGSSDDNNGYKYEHTVSTNVDLTNGNTISDMKKNIVVGRPMYINSDVIKGDFFLYLEITQGSDNYANTGKVQSSIDKMMLALSCPRPENLNSFLTSQIEAGRIQLPAEKTAEDCQAMIIGCEDADLSGTDNDMNDIVFLVVGFPELPPLREHHNKRYMIEDLGSTFDWDFNDIVIDVNEVVEYNWIKNTDGSSVKDEAHKTVTQTATLKHLCGTIPFKVKIGDTVLGHEYTALGGVEGKFSGNNANCETGGNGYDPHSGDEYYSYGLDKYTITGWDYKTNNIEVTSWPGEAGAWDPYTGQDNGLQLTPLSNISSSQPYTYGFPADGKFPYIIACDQNVMWTKEGENVDASWFNVKPADPSIPEQTSYPTVSNLNNINSDKFNLLISQLVSAGAASDDDIIKINVTNNSGQDRNGWGIGGIYTYNTNDNANRKSDEWKATSTTSYTYQYTLGQLKSWAGSNLGVAVVAYNGCIVSSIEIVIPTKYAVSFGEMTNGTATGDGTYAEGKQVTIKAIPASGYHFEQWNDGNKSNPRTITVTADVEYTAQFAEGELDYLWSVSSVLTPGQNPTFTLDFGNKTYEEGDKLVFNVDKSNDASLDLAFNNWSVKCSNNNDANAPAPSKTESGFEITLTQAMVNALNSNKTIQFYSINGSITLNSIELVKPTKYAVSISAGSNGLISVNSATNTTSYIGSAITGTTYNVQAVPADGYKFTRWSDDNTTNPRTFTVGTSDLSVSAIFEAIPYYTVTINTVTGGTASVTSGQNKSGNEYYEGNITLTAVPAAHYTFTRWVEDSNTANPRTYNLTSNVTFTPLFTEENTYEITLSNNISNGTASIKTSADKDGKYYASTQVTIEARPEDGYVVDYWTKDGSPISGATGTEYKFNPDGNAEYSVVFKEKPAGPEKIDITGYNNGSTIPASVFNFDFEPGSVKLEINADKKGQVQLLFTNGNNQGVTVSKNTETLGNTIEAEISDYNMSEFKRNGAKLEITSWWEFKINSIKIIYMPKN